MIINTEMARADWAARVAKQAEQMLIIAAAANDDDMRDELRIYAAELERHATEIKGSKSFCC